MDKLQSTPLHILHYRLDEIFFDETRNNYSWYPLFSKLWIWAAALPNNSSSLMSANTSLYASLCLVRLGKNYLDIALFLD